MKRTSWIAVHLSVCLLSSSQLAFAQAPPTPQPTCIQNVALEMPAEEGGDEVERVTLLLRDGRIADILPADAAVPAGMRIVDGSELICLPAFLDAFTRTGCEAPEPVIDQDIPVDVGADVRVDMRLANRKGIRPAFRVAEALAFEKKELEAWREAGFGAVHVNPAGSLLAGQSCVATTREAAMRDLVLLPDAFAHAAFAAEGKGYPSTLMGYIAQLRQFFMDAGWHAELQERYADGRPGIRPPFDAELEAGTQILAGKQTLLSNAVSHRDAERWIKMSERFGFGLALSNGRDAWRVAETLAEREIPVLMTLDWGKEVDDPRPSEDDDEEESEEESAEDEPGADADGEEAEEIEEVAEEEEADEAWTYDEPYAVRIERRLDWEKRRDCALRLHEAGVRFAFGTGDEKPKKLLEHVREVVEAGLSRDAALAALTTQAAEILGVARRLGRVQPGFDATLTLWSGDPFTDKKAQPVWIFVDGFETEFEPPDEKAAGAGPDEGVDPSGTWTLQSDDDGESRESTIVIEMTEDGTISGELTAENPFDQSEISGEVSGAVSGTTLTFEVAVDFSGTQATLSYTLELEGDELEGGVSVAIPGMPEPMTSDVTGTRTPDGKE